MWIKAIGRENFKPNKSHLVCSAHFIAEDYMDRPNGVRVPSGVRLKNLAVPSIFFSRDVSASTVTTPATASMTTNSSAASTPAIV